MNGLWPLQLVDFCKQFFTDICHLNEKHLALCRLTHSHASTGLPSLVCNVWELEKISTNEVYVLMKLFTNKVLQQNLCSNEGIPFLKKCHAVARSTTSKTTITRK